MPFSLESPSGLLSALESRADPRTSLQGVRLHEERRVHVLQEIPGPSELKIQGFVHAPASKVYEPALLLRDGQVNGRCTCELPKPCEHLLALARAWVEKRSGRPELPPARTAAWKQVFDALSLGRRRRAQPGQDILVHWLSLTRRRAGPWTLTVTWRVHRLSTRGIGKGRIVPPEGLRHADPAAATEADARVIDAALSGLFRRPYERVSHPLEVDPSLLDPLLRALADAPWVRWEDTGEPVRLVLDPLKPLFRAHDRGGEVLIRTHFPELDECPRPGLRILGSISPWLECGGVLRPITGVADGGALAQVLEGEVVVPPEEVAAFLAGAVPAMESRGLSVELFGVDSRDFLLSDVAKPRLYLSEEEGCLVAQLRFAYGDYEVWADNPLPVLSVGAGEEIKRYLRRDMDEEFAAASRLRDLGFHISEPGRFELSGEAALDFLLKDLEPLSKEWEVFGQDALRHYRVNAVPVSLKVRLSAGVDWLDLSVAAETELGLIPLEEVLRAFRAGSRYVRLGGGGHSLLPREWVERIGAALHELGLEKGRGRLPNYMAPLVQELLSAAPEADYSGADVWERLVSGLRDPSAVPERPLPVGLRAELRPYQIKGYRWLCFLGELGLGGVLADDMGLGKTVQTLALLLSELEAGRDRPSLVVAPTSVVANWEGEARRFAPDLQVSRYHGADRKDVLTGLSGRDLVVTTYAILRRDAKELGAVDWNYAVLDEAQAIKNAATQTARSARRLKARRRLTLTGTPMENHLGELWSQFQFLMPGLLGGEKHFAKTYARPIAQGDAAARDALRRRIRPFILRRMKREVASELPEKVESVLLCQMGPEQDRLYRSLLAASRERVFREVAERGFANSRISILDALLRLRQVCCHPEILPGDLGRGVPSAKFELFCEFVSEVVEEGHRVLVFSQFVKVLQILRRWFEASGISHLYLDGRVKDRDARVARFQEDESVSAFLVSLKAGGTGLNLTGADYVILYDPWWNPAVESQATDRAHRIGQTRKVFSYKLITQGSVEEKILALQERKKGLTDDLIRSEAQWGEAFTADDLEELFGE